MTKQIRNQMGLLISAVRAHELPRQPRFCRWAKRICEIDTDQPPAAAFRGPLISRTWTPVEMEPTLYLVKTQRAEPAFAEPEYHLVVMDSAGGLRVLDDPNLPNDGYPFTTATVTQVAALLDEFAELRRTYTLPYTLSLQFLQDVAHRIAMLPVEQWPGKLGYILELLDSRADSDEFTLILEELNASIDSRLTVGMW